MPPDEKPALTADADAGAESETDRAGLADWLWVPLLTAAILAALIVIGRDTFVA